MGSGEGQCWDLPYRWGAKRREEGREGGRDVHPEAVRPWVWDGMEAGFALCKDKEGICPEVNKIWGEGIALPTRQCAHSSIPSPPDF
jgi:hypothetical protein